MELKLSNVSKVFLTPRGKLTVLDNLNLTLNHFGLYGILGCSGSGKTTLLNICGFLDRPTSGQYVFNRINTSKLSEKKLQKIKREEIGYIYQHYYLFSHLTVLENLILPLLIKNKNYPEAIKKAEKLLTEWNLLFLKDQLAKTLSGGETQRIAIMRVILTKPRVILADEPTGALDKHNSHFIMTIIKKLSKDAIIILVTHNEQLAQKFCDEIFDLKGRQLIPRFNYQQ